MQMETKPTPEARKRKKCQSSKEAKPSFTPQPDLTGWGF